MSILRKIKRILISPNNKTGNVDDLGGQSEYHVLTEQNSLESYYVEHIQNQHCGCFGPPGGRCSVCGKVSCVRCHFHCGGTENQSPAGCGAPLCREHAYHLQWPDGRSVPFCKHCHGKIIRKDRWYMVGRLLLSPFIRRKDYERY